jgi:flagellar hook-length control protein FliK
MTAAEAAAGEAATGVAAPGVAATGATVANDAGATSSVAAALNITDRAALDRFSASLTPSTPAMDSAAIDAGPQGPAMPFQLDMAALAGVQDKRGRDDGLSLPRGGAGQGSQSPDASASIAAASDLGFPSVKAASTDVKPGPAINTPEFTQALAERVGYLVANNLNGATLQVNPPQLGPIELRVSVEAGHAQVWMSAHNPATLDALQSSSGNLREMLSTQGFGQVSVDISQRSFQDGSPYSQSRPWTPAVDPDAVMTTGSSGSGALRTSQGLLDAYA